MLELRKTGWDGQQGRRATEFSFSTPKSFAEENLQLVFQGVSTETPFLPEMLGKKRQEEVPVPPGLSPCRSRCSACLASLHLSEKG